MKITLPAELSEKEVFWFREILHGKTVAGIARERDRSLKTISTQKINIYHKLGIKNDISLWREILLNPKYNATISNDYSNSSLANLKKNYLLTKENLVRAIAGNELKPWAQPVFSAVNNTLIGCEILGRWVHPEKGGILPDIFIPIAEVTELIVPLTSSLMVQTAEILGAASSFSAR